MELKYFTIDSYYELGYYKQGYQSIRLATNLEEAFDKSIEAWNLRSDGKAVLNIVASCGLCDVFLDTNPNKKCDGCPIYLETGSIYCGGNVHYLNYSKNNGGTEDVKSIASTNAKAEAEWLIELKKKYVTGKIAFKEKTPYDLEDLKTKIITEYTKQLSEGSLYRISGENFIEKVTEIFNEIKVETNERV